MVLGAKSAFISDICVNDNVVERVHVFKLLGVLLDDNLKWDSHVDEVCAKASTRLHFLKILKRCSLNSDDLLYFYTTVIRPILYTRALRGTTVLLTNKAVRLNLFRNAHCQ